MTEVTITFKGKEHKARFLAVIQQIGKVYDGKIDPEYGAALFVLTSDYSTWDQAQDYVKRDGILFEALLQECYWSGGYRVLIQWAANLFNEYALPAIEPVELMRLDESNFRIAVSALYIRRGGLSVSKAELYHHAMDERSRISAENREKPWLPFRDGE
jgi:hypothetical protein